MTRYDHAGQLHRTQPPLSRLDYLVRQLGVWADLNPALLSLHSEFKTIARELRAAGAGNIPAEISPPGTPQETPGKPATVTPAAPPPRGCGRHHAGECASEPPYTFR